MNNKIEVFFGFALILVFGLFIFSMVSPKYSINPFENDITLTYDFCKNSGYGGSLLSGTYSKYKGKDYGRVVCFNSYVEGSEYTALNVTKDWRGNLQETETINKASLEVKG